MKSGMKKSRKYLLRSLLTIYAMVFIFVGVNRATESSNNLSEQQNQQTQPEELATFKDFTALRSTGDFNLIITQSDVFSIEYIPAEDNKGNFNASMSEETLIIAGFGNREDNLAGEVRVSLPVLLTLTTGFNPQVNINGFAQESIELDLRNHFSVSLTDNRINLLKVNAEFVREINLAENTLQEEQLNVNGNTVIYRK